MNQSKFQVWHVCQGSTVRARVCVEAWDRLATCGRNAATAFTVAAVAAPAANSFQPLRWSRIPHRGSCTCIITQNMHCQPGTSRAIVDRTKGCLLTL